MNNFTQLLKQVHYAAPSQALERVLLLVFAAVLQQQSNGLSSVTHDYLA